MTDQQISQARAMRSQGQTWSAIAKVIGVDPETVRRGLDPTFDVGKRRRMNREARQRRMAGKSSNRHVAESIIKESRNPAYDPRRDGSLSYRSIGDEIMGDPPIGRSALDMRVSQ